MILAEEKNLLVVGLKEVTKAIKNQNCKKIFLADDCTVNITDKLLPIAGGIEIVKVSTMRELGDMCEIDVGASCAAIKLV